MIFSTVEKYDYSRLVNSTYNGGIPEHEILNVFNKYLNKDIVGYINSFRKKTSNNFKNIVPVTIDTGETYYLKNGGLAPVHYSKNNDIDMFCLVDTLDASNSVYTGNLFANDSKLYEYINLKKYDRFLLSFDIDFADHRLSNKNYLKTHVSNKLNEMIVKYYNVTDIVFDAAFINFKKVNFDSNYFLVIWEVFNQFMINDRSIKIGIGNSSKKLLNYIIDNNLILPDFCVSEINIFCQKISLTNFCHNNNIEIISENVFARELRKDEISNYDCVKWAISNNINPIIDLIKFNEIVSVKQDFFTPKELDILTRYDENFILDVDIDDFYLL